MTQKALVQALHSDFEQGVIKVYQSLKPGFLGIANKISQDSELISQSYHDAVIAFIEIWNKGKYDPEKGQLNTLIYTIGKNQLLKKLKKKPEQTLELEQVFGLACELREYKNSELQTALSRALLELGEKCQEVIKLFYYYNYSNEAIMHRMNYENENTVKAHKSRCLRKLKELVKAKVK